MQRRPLYKPTPTAFRAIMPPPDEEAERTGQYRIPVPATAPLPRAAIPSTKVTARPPKPRRNRHAKPPPAR
jgi:hypothetical protein